MRNTVNEYCGVLLCAASGLVVKTDITQWRLLLQMI